MKVCGVDRTALESIIQNEVKPDAFIGRTIKGRYQITKKLGEGGRILEPPAGVEPATC
jgi:hypothetical protein